MVADCEVLCDVVRCYGPDVIEAIREEMMPWSEYEWWEEPERRHETHENNIEEFCRFMQLPEF